MKASLANLVGGQELYYPQSVRVRHHIESAWRRTAKLYGYEEFGDDMPVSVHYARRFKISNGSLGRPAYTWSGRVFHYDNVGCESPRADVEAIAIAKRSLDAIGLPRTSYRIRLNDARIVQAILEDYLELDAIQTELMTRLLAEKRMLTPVEFRDRAIDIVGRMQAGTILQQLAKVLAAKNAEELPEAVREHNAYQDLAALYARLEALGITGVVLDLTLSYADCTAGVLFDIVANDEKLLYRGGRMVAPSLETLVASLGDMAHIVEALEKSGHAVLPSATEVYVAAVGRVFDTAERIAEKLRSERIHTEVDYTGRTLAEQLVTAVEKDITYVMLIDEASVERQTYTLKNLRDGTDKTVGFERIVTAVSDRRVRVREDDDFDLSEFLDDFDA